MSEASTTNVLSTYLKDLESSDIQYTDEVLTLVFGIQGLVDLGYEPLEHTGVQSLGQSRHGKLHLGHGLTFGDPLSADLDLWHEESLEEISAVDSQKMSNLKHELLE